MSGIDTSEVIVGTKERTVEDELEASQRTRDFGTAETALGQGRCQKRAALVLSDVGPVALAVHRLVVRADRGDLTKTSPFDNGRTQNDIDREHTALEGGKLVVIGLGKITPSHR